jgi:general secretion pathway protein K
VKADPATATYIPDDDNVAVFRQLLRKFDIEERYADLLADWIDTDIAPYGSQGGEDTLYLTQNPPYRPPNTFITHPSELLALPGFGAENYRKIAPYVTALPFNAKVNVCTASGPVLDATKNDPQNQDEFSVMPNLAEQRDKGCFPELAGFLNGVSADQRSKVEPRVEDKSQWFRMRTHIRIGTAEFVLYSVLFRQDDQKVRTLQRSFGSE